MVSGFRSMTSLVPIKRGPGLVLDWIQAAGAFAVGGDSRDIVIWDASSETKIDVRAHVSFIWISSQTELQTISTQSNSPLTALVADPTAGPAIVAGFADGAVKAYDRRIRDPEAIVRTYRQHSSLIVGARCQKNGNKDLVTARFVFLFNMIPCPKLAHHPVQRRWRSSPLGLEICHQIGHGLAYASSVGHIRPAQSRQCICSVSSSVYNSCK